jgi:aspartyl-tRNA(Asn)/glutamyl-tRNA(Gln) amidotransferase subunit A
LPSFTEPLLSFHSIQDYQTSLLNGTTTCVEAVEFFLRRIDANKKLNAFTEVFATEALEKAAMLDRKRATGKLSGKLHGVVIGIKDVICYKDHKVTAASHILHGFTATYNATAVQKLLDEEAIIIGTCNCDEFAMGSSNENSFYGPTLNALDESRVPGGSSGGSAVAVQAGLCMASLGSDTGGSVRQPGVVIAPTSLASTWLIFIKKAGLLVLVKK